MIKNQNEIVNYVRKILHFMVFFPNSIQNQSRQKKILTAFL